MTIKTYISKLWHVSKVVLGRKFVALKVYIRKKRIKINNLNKKNENEPQVSKSWKLYRKK